MTRVAYVVITARGGSTGIPLKNLRKIGPHSLVAWSVLYATRHGIIPIVSTDSEAIATECQRYGAMVPRLRDDGLSLHDTHSVPVVLDALRWLKPLGAYDASDVAVLLEPTSPFRSFDLMQRALEPILAGRAHAAVSVTKALNEHPSNTLRSHAAMLIPDENTIALGKPRQQLSERYFPEGSIYASSIPMLEKTGTFYHSQTALIEVDAISKIDIDTPEDLTVARWIWGGMSQSRDQQFDELETDNKRFQWMLRT